MNAKIHQQLANRKRRIERRLDKKRLGNTDRPVFTAANIHYEIADRVHGVAHGGIGAFHLLARRIGLIDTINQKLHLLKFPMPYHHSDHVLNFAYTSVVCGGSWKERSVGSKAYVACAFAMIGRELRSTPGQVSPQPSFVYASSWRQSDNVLFF